MEIDMKHCLRSDYKTKRSNYMLKIRKLIKRHKLDDKIKELEHQLKLEKAKSGFWKCKAIGIEPLLCGSKEDIKYITS